MVVEVRHSTYNLSKIGRKVRNSFFEILYNTYTEDEEQSNQSDSVYEDMLTGVELYLTSDYGVQNSSSYQVRKRNTFFLLLTRPGRPVPGLGEGAMRISNSPYPIGATAKQCHEDNGSLL